MAYTVRARSVFGGSGEGSTYERVVRVLAFAVGVAGLVFPLARLDQGLQQVRVMEVWWSAVALPLVLGAPLVLIVGAFRLPIRWLRGTAAAYALGHLALVVALPLAATRGSMQVGDWPWICSMFGVVVAATALRWRWGVLAAYCAVAAASYSVAVGWLFADRGVLGLAHLGAVEAGYAMLFGGAALLTVHSARLLDKSAEAAAQEAMVESAIAARELERARIDALVHDHVMSALLAVHRAEGAGVSQAAARQGLAALDSLGRDAELLPVTARELVARLRQACVALCGDASFNAQVADPTSLFAPQVAALFQEVLGEAVRNSVRHAGDGARIGVCVVVAADEAALTVADDGKGFDRRAVPPRRLGIAVGVVGRAALVSGAEVNVRSDIGAGTTVVLRWRAKPPGSS